MKRNWFAWDDWLLHRADAGIAWAWNAWGVRNIDWIRGFILAWGASEVVLLVMMDRHWYSLVVSTLVGICALFIAFMAEMKYARLPPDRINAINLGYRYSRGRPMHIWALSLVVLGLITMIPLSPAHPVARDFLRLFVGLMFALYVYADDALVPTGERKRRKKPVKTATVMQSALDRAG